MAFSITPVAQPSPALVGAGFIQFRSGGEDLGDRRVAVIDVVADPADVRMTRGVGANAHVVTLRRITPGDPLFSSAILIWNMREDVGTSPPVDQSTFGKVHGTFGANPLYGVDSSDGPFPGCGSNNRIRGASDTSSRSFATDAAWDFSSSTQTLTVEGWVKVAPVAGNAKISTVRPIGGAGSGSWLWPSFIYAGGVVSVAVDVIGLTPLSTAAGIPPGVWAHYVMQTTGATTYVGVAGVRVGSFTSGNLTLSDMALQFGGTSLGSNVGAGALLGPHRVSISNRYALQANSTYTPPSSRFPVYAA